MRWRVGTGVVLRSCPTKRDHWLISWRLDTGDREENEDEFDGFSDSDDE